MSTKEKLEERKFILECIELYKTLPALWNIKSKDYSNRDKKNQQYDILLCKYKERFHKADKTDVIRKFNSLRTNFRKELRKIRDSKKGSDCTEDSSEPTLWYFDQMRFLINTCDPCYYQNSVADDEEFCEPETVELKERELKKKKKLGSATDELVRLATQRLKAPQDSCHQLGIVWGNKLSKMDRNQRIIAEKVINEVMFNGELGLLNFHTTLTNISTVSDFSPPLPIYSKHNTETDANESISESPSQHDSYIADNEFDPLEHKFKPEEDEF